MADPLSATASIVAILQLSSKLLQYLRGVTDAPKERRRLVLEISSLRGVLETLQDTLNDATTNAWASTRTSLTHSQGPLALLETSLKEIVRKVGKHSRPPSKIDILANSLKWPFKEREIEKLLSVIERQKSLLLLAFDNDSVALSAAIYSDTQAILSRISGLEDAVQQGQDRDASDRVRNEAREQEAKAEKLLQWLSPINHYSKQNDVLRTRLEGTGAWLLENADFLAWSNGSKRTCFCTGIPGSGKTVLTSIVIQHIRRISDSDPSVGLAWIYVDYKQRKAQTLESLLGSLVAQLIRGRIAREQPEALKAVEDFNQKYHQNVTASAKDLSIMLSQEARHFRTVYIIIDALDECGEDDFTRDDLLDAVQALPLNVQLFLTSRDIPRVEANIEDPLRIEVWASQEDVENYVIGRINGDRYLNTHCTADAKLQEQITRALTNNSGGMFLLARLHMDLLQRKAKRSKWAVKEAITELPGTLDETYGDAMERIRSQHPDDVELALRALKWVYFALEPLNLKDFQYAMIIIPGDTDIHQDRVDEPEYIASVCAGLIQLDKDAQVIRPVHETAQSYFERQTEEFSGAHAQIAASCLTYFLSKNFYQIPTNVRRVDLVNSRGPVVYRARAWSFLSQHCFAKYAATYALAHVYRTSGSKLLLDMLIRLCLEGAKLNGNNSSPFIAGPKLTAFLLAQPEEVFSIGSFANMGPLQFAVYHRLNELVPTFIERGVDINGRDYNQHTPLHVSICVGNVEATEILLDANAHVNMPSRIAMGSLLKDELWETPLGEATYRGCDSIAIMLVQKGARTHGPGYEKLGLVPQKGLPTYQPKDDAAGFVEDVEDSALWDDHIPELDDSDECDGTDGGSAAFAEVWRSIPESSVLSEKSSDISRSLYMLSKHVNLTDVGFAGMINTEDDRGKRPLDWALDEGNIRVLRNLLSQGALINDFRMLEKAHADRYSLNSGVVECLREILEARPALQLDGADASALFSQAAHYGNYALIRLLLRREGQMGGAALISYRALLKIVESGETDMVEPILKRAANPVHDDPGPPMIWVASFLGHTEMVKVLHGLGANINVSCYGLGTILGTPLGAAASSAKLDTMKLLVSLGAKLNMACSRLGTAFDIATALGRTGVLEYLIRQGGSSCGSKSMLTTEIYSLTFSKVAAGTG